MLTHLSLFTGIGGIDLAAEWIAPFAGAWIEMQNKTDDQSVIEGGGRMNKLSTERIEKAKSYAKNYVRDSYDPRISKEEQGNPHDAYETMLAALEAVEKIFAWCKTVLKYSEEPCDGPVNSAHNVYMYGERECAKKILKILGGENEK